MKTTASILLVTALAITACHPHQPSTAATDEPAPSVMAEPMPTSVDYYASEGTRAAGYPFADAVRVGDLWILSGQIGVDPETFELVDGGIEAESRRTLDNVRRILEAQGLSYDDIVKCTVMLADIGEWPTFNTIYQEYFPSGRYPARSAFAASGLALGARVEVECWAATGG